MKIRTVIRTRYSPQSPDLPVMSSLEVGADVEIDLETKSGETIAMRLQAAREMAKHVAEEAVPTAMEVLDYVHRRVEFGGTGVDRVVRPADSAGPGAGITSGTQEEERNRAHGSDELPPDIELG